MVNKGRIVFINGYWIPGFIGRVIINSAFPRERYWLADFEKEAELFLGLNEAPNTHKYIDASSLIGIDMSGMDRYNKAFKDYNYEENDEKQNDKTKNKLRYANYNNLTEAMDKEKHDFYIITHSEGGAYGSGLAQLLINKGWNIKLIIHLSTDEATQFDTPAKPLTYQLGVTARRTHNAIAWGDWVTNNFRINKGVDKFAIAYQDLSSIKIHNKSRCGHVFQCVRDLQTVQIRLVTDNKGKSYFEQVPGSTTYGTQFTTVNGIKLRYKPIKIY